MLVQYAAMTKDECNAVDGHFPIATAWRIITPSPQVLSYPLPATCSVVYNIPATPKETGKLLQLGGNEYEIAL